mmetsp:Transcript_10502/g.21243  ORF Transcript_10502/g.21243 Transcript_10502/m.21243 type:complete len:302 (+) Transcript_10502:140-1045(+)
MNDALHRAFLSRDFEASLSASASILCSTPVSGVTIVPASDPDGSKGSASFTLSTTSEDRDDASLIYLQSCAELKKPVEWDVLQGGSLEVYAVALKAVKVVDAKSGLSKHLELAAEVLSFVMDDPPKCCSELCEFVEDSVDVGFVNAVFGQTGAGSDADAAALFREKFKEKGVTWAPKGPPSTPPSNPQEQQSTKAREAFGSYSEEDPEDEEDFSEDDDDDTSFPGGYPGSVPSYYPSASSSSRRPAPSTTLSRPSSIVAYFQSLRAFLRLKVYPHMKELLAALVMCGGMAAILRRRYAKKM